MLPSEIFASISNNLIPKYSDSLLSINRDTHSHQNYVLKEVLNRCGSLIHRQTINRIEKDCVLNKEQREALVACFKDKSSIPRHQPVYNWYLHCVLPFPPVRIAFPRGLYSIVHITFPMLFDTHVLTYEITRNGDIHIVTCNDSRTKTVICGSIQRDGELWRTNRFDKVCCGLLENNSYQRNY